MHVSRNTLLSLTEHDSTCNWTVKFDDFSNLHLLTTASETFSSFPRISFTPGFRYLVHNMHTMDVMIRSIKMSEHPHYYYISIAGPWGWKKRDSFCELRYWAASQNFFYIILWCYFISFFQCKPNEPWWGWLSLIYCSSIFLKWTNSKLCLFL